MRRSKEKGLTYNEKQGLTYVKHTPKVEISTHPSFCKISRKNLQESLQSMPRNLLMKNSESTGPTDQQGLEGRRRRANFDPAAP
jgi:hypothetical protein